MTAVEQLLAWFDQMPLPDQEKAAKEIWHRLQKNGYGAIPDEALIELADEAFLRMDREEESIGKTQTW